MHGTSYTFYLITVIMGFLCFSFPLSSHRKIQSTQPRLIPTSPANHRLENVEEKPEKEKASTLHTTGTFSSATTTLQLAHYRSDNATVDLQELFNKVQHLESSYSKLSRHKKFGHAVEQIVQFCRRFAPSADVISQCGGGYAQLLWGCLRALLMCAETSIAKFYLIRSAVSRIGDILSISEQFQAAFETESRVQKALQSVYDETYEFLQRILDAVTKRAWQRLIRSATHSFDNDFKDSAYNLQRHMENLRDEIHIAHINRMEQSQRNVLSSISKTVAATESLVTHAVIQRDGDISGNITRWLCPADMLDDLGRASKKRTHGTGLWLLIHDKYKKWKKDANGTSNTLAIFGRPGSGKTVLTATIIDDIEIEIRLEPAQDLRPILTYFFCHAAEDDKRSITDIYATLLAQIIPQLTEVPRALEKVHNEAVRYGRTKRTEKCDLPGTFIEVAKTLPKVYVVLDGIDECEDSTTIVKSLTDLARTLPTLRLLLSSRPLQSSSHLVDHASRIILDSEILRPDVDLFLSHELSGLSTTYPDDLRQNAFRKLSAASSGMFLYASLGVVAVKSAVDPHSMAQALETLPEGVNGLYAVLLTRLSHQPAERRRLVRDILMWVCCSHRLLSWSELEYALSWDPSVSAFATDRKPFKSVVLELCSPLIEYHEERDVFTISHYSVQEFISTSGWELGMADAENQFLVDKSLAHSLISNALLHHLQHESVVLQIRYDSLEAPLLAYSTAHWCSHLVLADTQEEALRQSASFFLDNPQNRTTWIVRYILHNTHSMPLQSLMKHQKLCREWLESGQTRAPATFHVDDLVDIHEALLALDRLPASVNLSHAISNFERLQYVRDLVRGFNMSGALPRGIELFANALKSTQALCGPDAESTVWMLNALGLLYDQQHLTERAIEMQLRALSIQEREMAPDLDLVNTINELGRLHRHAGEYEQSEFFHNKALIILRSILPETDLQVIWTINTLGRCLQKSGRAQDALPLHRRALEVQIQVLGPDHPHAIWTLGDIARCHRDLGDVALAVEILQDALERRNRVLGPKHPDTLWTINDLGLLFEETGESEKAISFHSQAYNGQVDVLGSAHAHTLWSLDKVNDLTRRT